MSRLPNKGALPPWTLAPAGEVNKALSLGWSSFLNLMQMRRKPDFYSPPFTCDQGFWEIDTWKPRQVFLQYFAPNWLCTAPCFVLEEFDLIYCSRTKKLRELIGCAVIQSWRSWVRSVNSTSGLCLPFSLILFDCEPWSEPELTGPSVHRLLWPCCTSKKTWSLF